MKEQDDGKKFLSVERVQLTYIQIRALDQIRDEVLSSQGFRII